MVSLFSSSNHILLFKGLMVFSTPTGAFYDITNYVGRMSLVSFTKNYCNQTDLDGKGLFPHDWFRSIESMRETTQFPPYDAFKSELIIPTPAELEQ